jgi:predicted nucleic acid-binding Zn ribbon protein
MIPMESQLRRSKPEQLGGALRPLIDRLDSGGNFGLVRMARAWPEVVGEAIARRTEVVGLRFHTGIIKVSAASAMWLQELNLLRGQILSRLQEEIGKDIVRELRFIRGTISRRERPKAKSVTARSTRRAFELPEMRDPELKRAFERLIEAWGRAPR